MKSLIIIGGGFAGTNIAKKLESKFKTTLIDTKDYFEFTPGILRTIIEPNHSKKIQRKHSSYLKKTEIITGCVKKIDKNYIYLEDKKIPFDYLVIATGSKYNEPFKEENTLLTNRANTIKKHHDKIVSSKNITIVGGGLVSVEIAGEILQKYKDKNITIIHSENKLIQRQNKKSIDYATNFLKKNNISIIYNELGKEFKEGYVTTNKGSKIKTDFVFLATGIKPNSSFIDKKFLDDKHFIKVNEYLQLTTHKNIFVAGDVTNIKEEKLAQNAEIHAKLISKNILNLENKKNLKKYYSKKRIVVISLGKYNGILEKEDFVLTGFVPGILKSLIEWEQMIRY